MSASPFIQSAGRGDLLFWGGGEGPTVVIWESLSEQEKESWLEEASTMHDWVVWCRSKKTGGGNSRISVDAEWAGYTNTRRSHTGYIWMMNGGSISESWKSR